MFIILEFMDQKSMFDIVTNNYDNYSEEFCKYTLYKVASGLAKMHHKNVLHRDIKSENILSSSDGEIKIADLGFSKPVSPERKTRAGTVPFYSPELAKGIRYSKEVDVWAFGCFAYELATGFAPFASESDEAKLFESIINKHHEELDDRWSPSFNDFINKCLIKDAEQRWTMERLLQHEFLIELKSS